MKKTIAAHLSDFLKKPITWIMFFNMVLFLIGITWGLPSSEDWHSDSLAPYHPLLGLSQGFSFGYLNKYPLVHQVILALLNIPVAVAAFINSNPMEGLNLSKFLMLIRSPEYASVLTLTDRLVSVFMGLGIIYWMYRCVKELFNERTALFTALLLSFDAVLNFYSHMAKVEVPYIFWGVLGIYMLIRVVKYDNLKDYICLALFSCLSYGTKDQGYALFVLPFIFYLAIYRAVYREAGKSVLKAVFSKNLLWFCFAFILITLITQNIFFNLEGFLYRFEILTGWNGQRSISYTLTPAGIWALFTDGMASIINGAIGLPLFLLYTAGIIFFIAKRFPARKEFFLESIFLLSALSTYLFFILVIRQDGVRFFLPITIFMTVYGAYLLNFLYEKLRGKVRVFAGAVFAVICVYSFYLVFSVNMNFLNDLRYDAEEWMKKNIPADSTLEYYSYLHYLPRFPRDVFSYRIKNDALSIEKRKPDFIVLTSHYYPRFLPKETESVVVDGRIVVSARAIDTRTTNDMNAFLTKLFNGELNYVQAAKFQEGKTWYRKVGHASISPEHIIIYRRSGDVQNNAKVNQEKAVENISGRAK